MDAANKKIGAYSKGMRQRVKLAQAIVHDPELLILDEPLTGMDPIMRRRTIRQIKDWARAGKSIIVSSHILHEVESMTSNILLINNGRILAEGNVHQIRDLIDKHPHTVFIRVADPRALAAHAARGRRGDQHAVRAWRARRRDGAPRRVLRAPDGHGRVRRSRRDRRGHLARRQPAGGVPVPGETVMSEAPIVAGRRCGARVFDLSLGELLWSRRTIFMALVVGAPVLLAIVARIVQASGIAPLRVNGVRVDAGQHLRHDDLGAVPPVHRARCSACSTARRWSPTKSRTRRSPISSRGRCAAARCCSASIWPTSPAPRSSCCRR